MTDPADLIATIAPEFAESAQLQGAIDIADMQIAEGLCGDKRPLLVAYLAAHILTVATRKGSGGPVTGLTEGSLSISFGSSGIMGSLSQSSYGQEYHRLSRACVFAPRTRVKASQIPPGLLS